MSLTGLQKGNIPENAVFVTTLQNPEDKTLWDLYQSYNRDALFVSIKLVSQDYVPVKGNYRVCYNVMEKRMARTNEWLALLRFRSSLQSELHAFCGQEWPVAKISGV